MPGQYPRAHQTQSSLHSPVISHCALWHYAGAVPDRDLERRDGNGQRYNMESGPRGEQGRVKF